MSVEEAQAVLPELPEIVKILASSGKESNDWSNTNTLCRSLENEHQLNVCCSLEKLVDDSEREHDAPVQDFLRAGMV